MFIKKKQAQSPGNASIQEWLPISDIRNNLIYRKDNHVVAVVRVQPKNINLLSDREKIRHIKRLEEALNGIEYHFQILSIARPVDLDAFIMKMERMRSETDNMIRKKLLTIYIRQAAMMASSGEALERQFYVLIDHQLGQKPHLDEDFVKQRAIQLASNLSSAELYSSLCTDNELRTLQFIFSNPAHASFERAPKENYSLPPLLHMEAIQL